MSESKPPPKNVVLHAEPIRIDLTPVGLHYYGAEFLAAARQYEPDRGFSPVCYYLYGHALELLFKAYLRKQGFGEKGLKRIGHDLVDAARKAEAHGIRNFVTVTEAHSREIEKANEYYEKKGFEYFPSVGKVMRGYPGLPDLQVLDDLACKLADGLKAYCFED